MSRFKFYSWPILTRRVLPWYTSILPFIPSIFILPLLPGVLTLVYSVKLVQLPLYLKALSLATCQYTSPASAGLFTASIVDFLRVSDLGDPPFSTVSKAIVAPGAPAGPGLQPPRLQAHRHFPWVASCAQDEPRRTTGRWRWVLRGFGCVVLPLPNILVVLWLVSFLMPKAY